MLKSDMLFSKSSDEKYYLQLFKIFKAEIDEGRLLSGSKLPSVRQTAMKYKVNMNTVLQAYNLLEKNGLIEKVPGKGCFIKEGSDFTLDIKVHPILENFRYGQERVGESVNFSNGTPPAEYFPASIYKELAREVIEECGAEIFEYQNVQGLESLRVVLSEELEKDDIFVTEDDILITSGTQQALDIVLNLFHSSSGLTIALSDPTYPNALNLFTNMCKIKGFDLKNDGWDMDEFEKILKTEKINLVYEVFNFQNPTGIKWSEEKKKKLLELAAKYDFYIIEDDTFSEFYYEGEKPSTLKSFDKTGSERVIYIRTYSKTIMPGISTALMVAPRKFMEKAVLIKYSLDPTASGLNQRILEYFIREGYLSEHISYIKSAFKEKYNYMLNLLREVPYLQIMHVPTGGFFIWILLAEHIDGEKFYKYCRERGVYVLPGSVFYNDRRAACKIRLTFVSSSLEEIKKGVDVIKDILIHCKHPE